MRYSPGSQSWVRVSDVYMSVGGVRIRVRVRVRVRVRFRVRG